MKYASLFSGVEAASLAWEPLGWRPAFFAEIDSFCNSVLHYRWPTVPNLGDVSTDAFLSQAKSHGPLDLLVGGSPCQAFSLSGRRRGLFDPRGQLTLRYIDILRELRPRWFVWENVPGVFTQDGGRVFGTLLGEMADCGYRLAWRVLDASLAGVPQRRRRVFVVGHSGSLCPGRVLLVPDSQGQHPEKGQGEEPFPAGTAPSGTGMVGDGRRIVGPVLSFQERGRLNGRSLECIENQAYALTAPRGGGRGQERNVAYAFTIKSFHSCDRQNHAIPCRVTKCLDTTGGLASSQGGTVRNPTAKAGGLLSNQEAQS